MAANHTLFLDMDGIESRHNVVQTVVEATKHPDNPLLPLGDLHEWDALQARPWETNTIIYDAEEQLFKCWYAGSDISTERWWATGYAVSDDGVHWSKPRLCLHEYQGSTDNNICVPGYGPIMQDTEDTLERRYKMVLHGGPWTEGVGRRVAYSPDGINWEPGPPIASNTPGIIALFRDDQEPNRQRRYKAVYFGRVQTNKAATPARVRTKCLAYGPDIEHLTPSLANPIISPNDGLEQEVHFLQLTPYEGQYVMLYEYGWYVPNGTGLFGQYAADIRLAVSRDGEHFQRVQPHQPVIRRGQHGSWDSQFLIISGLTVVRDDLIYLYYAGQGEDWTQWPGENKRAEYRYASSGSVRLSRMGLATLPRDRWTCLETTDRETPGSVTTRPLHIPRAGTGLVLNVSDTQQNRSWLEVEVLAADRDEPLPGFGRSDCEDVCRDGVVVPVRWSERRLGDLADTRVRLRFWLCGAARLYSWSFEQDTAP